MPPRGNFASYSTRLRKIARLQQVRASGASRIPYQNVDRFFHSLAVMCELKPSIFTKEAVEEFRRHAEAFVTVVADSLNCSVLFAHRRNKGAGSRLSLPAWRDAEAGRHARYASHVLEDFAARAQEAEPGWSAHTEDALLTLRQVSGGGAPTGPVEALDYPICFLLASC